AAGDLAAGGQDLRGGEADGRGQLGAVAEDAQRVAHQLVEHGEVDAQVHAAVELDAHDDRLDEQLHRLDVDLRDDVVDGAEVRREVADDDHVAAGQGIAAGQRRPAGRPGAATPAATTTPTATTAAATAV